MKAPGPREQFGRFLRRTRELQGLSAYRVAKRAAGSADLLDSWKARLKGYESGREVPSPETLAVLAEALKFPWPSLLVTAEHLNIVLGCLAAAIIDRPPENWQWPVRPRTAAFERLFMLFPGGSRLERDDSFADFAGVDSRLTKTCALQYIMDNFGQNVGGDGDHVKRCWPYQAWVLPSLVDPDHLICELTSSIDANPRHPIFADSRLSDLAYMSRATGDGPVYRAIPTNYMAIRAERYASMADDITGAIFGRFPPIDVRELSPLSEALAALATETMPWPERCAIAGIHIHSWADKIDAQSKHEADQVRRCLYPLEFRKITEDQYNSIRASMALRATPE